MPLLLWYSCLDTKSTWTSIWSQHAALHVRQPLSQNSLFLFLSHSLPACLCICLLFCWYLTFCIPLKVIFLWYNGANNIEKITRLHNNIVGKAKQTNLGGGVSSTAWSWCTSYCLRGLNSVTDEVSLHVSNSNHFFRQSENRRVGLAFILNTACESYSDRWSDSCTE